MASQKLQKFVSRELVSRITENASQKLVSRVLLPYESIHNNRDIFYDEMLSIFFMNSIAKPHVKRLSDAEG